MKLNDESEEKAKIVFMLKTYAFGNQKLYVAEVYSYYCLVMYCILVIKTIRNSCI